MRGVPYLHLGVCEALVDPARNVSLRFLRSSRQRGRAHL
jgi:hypothetical protein